MRVVHHPGAAAQSSAPRAPESRPAFHRPALRRESGILGLFFWLPRERQAQRMRAMRSAGFTENQIAILCRWRLEDVREAMGVGP